MSSFRRFKFSYICGSFHSFKFLCICPASPEVRSYPEKGLFPSEPPRELSVGKFARLNLGFHSWWWVTGDSHWWFMAACREYWVVNVLVLLESQTYSGEQMFPLPRIMFWGESCCGWEC
jgi:hypothetical protein